MPKMKTHSGSSKRFKKLKSGLFKMTRAFRRHLLAQKSTKRKRDLRQSAYVHVTDAGRLKTLLPN